MRYRPTWNLTAETGDPSAADTIVILGHHDAAHSGLLFHPAVPKWMHEHMRKQVESAKQSTPYWVGIVGAPALVTLGSLIGTPVGRMMTRLGTALGAAWSALIVDIGNRDAVPGANDNLSATAVQVHLARALRDRPIKALRVLLVSCGSEETLQEGILAYAQRHFPDLDPERTHFLTIDTVGSGHLFMAEGEGTLKVREFSPEFKELIADTAQASDIDLQRGISARSSTDACVPLRAGYPTALLASLDDHRALANYHWPTDTAENLDYGCVADCAALLEAVIRRAAIQMEHSE